MQQLPAVQYAARKRCDWIRECGSDVSGGAKIEAFGLFFGVANVEHKCRTPEAFGVRESNPKRDRAAIGPPLLHSIDRRRADRGLERPRETRVAVASTDERRSVDSRGTRRVARSPAARARARGRRDDA
jgi:hypothetical protein